MKEKLIYQSIMEHTPDGGSPFMVVGPKGAGKTILLQRMARDACRMGEKVIWRAKDVDTWSVFSHFFPINLIVQGSNVRVDHVPIIDNPEPLQTVLITTCESPDDAWEQCEKGFINVIVTSGLTPVQQAAWWTLLFHTLIKRKSNEWISVFMDEIDEVFPENPTDEWWHISVAAVDYFASFRKTNINFRCSAHKHTLVNANLRAKIHYHGYVRGAQKIPGSPLRQSIINNAEIGHPILTDAGRFNILDIPITNDNQKPHYVDKVTGRASFDMYSREIYWQLLQIQPHWVSYCGDCTYVWEPRNRNPPKCPRCGKYDSIATIPGSIDYSDPGRPSISTGGLEYRDDPPP